MQNQKDQTLLTKVACTKKKHPTILIFVLMLPHIELVGILAGGHQTSRCCQRTPDLCTWRRHGNQSYWFWAFKVVSTIKCYSSVSSLPYHAPVLAVFCCCRLKSCSSPAGSLWGHRRLSWHWDSGSFTSLLLFDLDTSVSWMPAR